MKAETKVTHTPGPWSLNEPVKTEVVSGYGAADISVAQKIRNIADAHLIAAAPELLEAAKEVIRQLEARFMRTGCNASEEIAMRQIRAAIAKADGR